MRDDDDAAALRNKPFDRRERFADANIIRQDAILNGHIEIHAKQNALARCIHLVDGHDIGHAIPFHLSPCMLPATLSAAKAFSS